MSDATTGTTLRPTHSTSRALWILLAVSLALKLLVLAFVGDTTPVLDETQYVHAGHSIAAGDGIQYTYERWHPLHQGPLYPYFLALVFRLGGDILAAKVVQVLLSTATVWATYVLGKRCFGSRAGFMAAALTAFYPTLIAFSHYNWSETFYVFWFTLAFVQLFGEDGRLASPRRLLGSGLLFGLAALSRPVIAYLAPVILLAIALTRGDSARRSAARGAAFALGFVLAILPQTIYIQHEYGSFALISAASGRMWHEAYNGYAPRTADHGFPRRLQLGEAALRPPVEEDNPVLRARAETRLGLRFLLDNPALCFRRFLVREAQYLNPTSFLVRHIRRGYYQQTADGAVAERAPPLVREAVVVATVASYLALALLALAGFFTLPAGTPRRLLLSTLFFFLLLHGSTFGMSRYRLIVVPLLAVAAGQLLAELRPSLERLCEPRRAIPCSITLVLLLYTWSVYWDKLWISPA